MNIKTANRLCELRKQHNLSQEELANRLGVSRQAVSKWERSESSPDTDNLILLAKLYNITIDELINGSNDVIELIEESKEETGPQTVKIENKEVKIDGDIAVVEGETYSINECLEREKKFNNLGSIFTGVYALITLIVYLLLGFLFNGFGIYWFLFILIPVPESIVEVIANKKISEFGFVFLVAAAYCALGTMFKMWHPCWLIFLLIPIFYIIFEPIDKKIVNKKHIVVQAYDELNISKEEH